MNWAILHDEHFYCAFGTLSISYAFECNAGLLHNGFAKKI